ncbi:hypothetical protein G6011_08984 [Alternaria panax]|uniref:Ubiquitin-like protease family profile domain-containing protein n=1 Tax=Alternaria panax TaxID=48097 RepID=A0AAD4NLW0_9PLEO|nr:hypothetical protein G6011_08984 [Alternaria panax]
MDASGSDYNKINVGRPLPEFSRSNLTVLPPLIGQNTPLVILSNISVFEDVKVISDRNARREPIVMDIELATNSDRLSLESKISPIVSRTKAIELLRSMKANNLIQNKASTQPIFDDTGKSCYNSTGNRRRRYSVDCTPFAPENNDIQDRKQLQGEFCAISRKEGDRIRRKYTDTFVIEHPFWKRHEGRSLEVDGQSRVENPVLETSNTSIDGAAYQAITKIGVHGWLHDQTIDMCFDLLERISKSEDYGIALSDTTFARHVFVAGEHYIGALQLLDAEESVIQHYEEPRFDSELIKKFKSKDFILFPINDGYATGLDAARHLQSNEIKCLDVNPNGTHWSIMIVDCRTPETPALYLDSIHRNMNYGKSANMNVAEHILVGLRLLFQRERGNECKAQHVIFNVDTNAPSQRSENKSGGVEGGSACGPFVFLIVKELVQYIIECREEGKQVVIGDLTLPPGFAAKLEWDSKHTREVIRKMIDRERRTRDWLNMTSAWFDVLPQPGNFTGWQTWLRSP